MVFICDFVFFFIKKTKEVWTVINYKFTEKLGIVLFYDRKNRVNKGVSLLFVIVLFRFCVTKK